MLKRANGGDDEKGRRRLTAADRAAILSFMKKRPKGQKDEKFHAFVEALGINPHGAEQVAYDALGDELEEKQAKVPGAQVEKALRMLRVGAEKARSFAAGAKRPIKLDPRLAKKAEVDPYWFMLEELEKMAAQKPKGLSGLTADRQLKDAQSVGQVKPLRAQDVTTGFNTFRPLNLIKKSFQVSQYSGPLTEGRFIYRNPQFQSSLPQYKLSGPDPEEQEGDREHFPEEVKKASLWKAAHFACSAIAAWEKNLR